MNNIFFVIIVISLISCLHDKTSKSKSFEVSNSKIDTSMHDEYKSVDIYSWCFLSQNKRISSKDTIERLTKECTTLMPLNASDIIRPSNLKFTTTKSEEIGMLSRLVFQGSKQVPTNGEVIDSRFVMIFHRLNYRNDTLILLKNNEMFYNVNNILRFPFNIVDSIEKVLQIKRIE